MKKTSRIQLFISLKNILNNYQLMQSLIGNCQLIPVLKADAYGLGAQIIGKYLASHGIKIVALADINEATDLDSYFSEIHLLGDVFDSEIENIVEHQWLCPSTSSKRLKSWKKYCHKNKLKVQFNIDTGMGQTGIPIENAEEVILEAANLDWVDIKGLYTHFTNADRIDEPFSIKQLQLFRKLVNSLEEKGLHFDYKHIGNSNAINFLPDSYKDFTHIRSGINLYGIQNEQTSKENYLKETLELKTSVIRIRSLNKGESIGYGCDFIAKDSMKIATLPIGYADGFPYQGNKGGFVLINDQKCPVVGRVSMDYTSVDISARSEVNLNDEVILIGKSNSHAVTVEDWAKWKNSIAYDVICSFGPRVEKVYLN